MCKINIKSDHPNIIPKLISIINNKEDLISIYNLSGSSNLNPKTTSKIEFHDNVNVITITLCQIKLYYCIQIAVNKNSICDPVRSLFCPTEKED